MSWSVLVVDDDASFRHLATRTLRSWGFAVVGEAGTFAEAVDRATELRPDAALVDIGLPDGDGFELAQRFFGAALAAARRAHLLGLGRAPTRRSPAGWAPPASYPRTSSSAASLRRLIGGE